MSRCSVARTAAVEIAVADNGPGIGDAEKPKVVRALLSRRRQPRHAGRRARPQSGASRGATARHRCCELEDNHPGLRASILLMQDTRPVAFGPVARSNQERSTMSQSIYEVTVPTLLKAFDNLAVVLDKGRAHAEQEKIEPAVLLNMRLYPNMFPLTRQVQIASDTAKGAVARLAAGRAAEVRG